MVVQLWIWLRIFKVAFNILCVRYLKSCSRHPKGCSKRGSTNPERLSKDFLSKLYGERHHDSHIQKRTEQKRHNRSRSRSLTRYYGEIPDTDDLKNSIPKREHTKKGVSSPRKFAEECIELFTHVGHVPGYRLAFNRFVPAFHKYFGRQCETSDYGFSNLIDLFKAISSTVKVNKI